MDCRTKRTITIDSDGTKTFDDACSLEHLPNGNLLLGIYVADVTKYITKYNQIVKNAHNIGENIHLPNKVITMLPEYVITAMSLNANNSRFAIGYFFELTPQMECCKFEAKQVIINPERNMSHTDIKNALDKSDDIELYQLLKDMLNVSEHLHDKNIYSRQYGTIKKIKNKIYRSEDLDSLTDSSIGSIIISEFMVLVGHYVTDFFDKNNIPFIYRINSSNNNDKLVESLKNKIAQKEPIDQILKYLNTFHIPSQYSTDNVGHRFLNLQSYGHVTTPIRKFAPFVSEYLIVEYMIKKSVLTDKHQTELDEYLKELCTHLNEREQLNQQYQQEYYKMYYKK